MSQVAVELREDSPEMPVKETLNLPDVRPSEEAMEHPEEVESEEERGGDGEDAVQPGLPKFLRRYVKIGKFEPVSLPKSGDVRMGESEALLEAPSLVTPLLIKKPDQFYAENGGAAREPKPEKKTLSGKGGKFLSEFFQSTAGEFLIGIGLSRALEVFNRDLIRVKEREMKKPGVKTEDMVQEHRKLTQAHQQAKMANEPYTFKTKSCRVCDFKTESSLVLEGHLLKPHLTSRRELQCSFCKYATRDAKAMVFHMEAVHHKLPTMDPPPQFYECPFCTFETNLKAKANAHVNRCQKYFNSHMNQLPSSDFQPPGVTAKPITIEDIKAYETLYMTLGTSASAKGAPNRTHPSVLRNGSPVGPRGAGPSLYQKLLLSASQNQNRGRPRLTSIQPTPAPNKVYQVVGSGTEVIPLLDGRPQLTVALTRPIKPATDASGRPGLRAAASQQAPSAQRPRMPAILDSSNSGARAFVICEICDGYIRDLEQLRTHMLWIHKVKVHAKLLTSRPPLNCQKCQWRFFTDQGLERHLLGAHGLVTSNMQELANSGKDSGRCTVCGRVYAAKLVAHMGQVHRVALKPAHLSYKCTVCTETFNLYRLFETHVYTVHGGGLKRPSPASSSDDKPAKRPVTAKRASDRATTKTKQESEGSNGISAKSAPKSPTSGSSETEEEYVTKVAVAPAEPADPQMGTRCATCEEDVEDLREHMKEKHVKDCYVRVCHIEKCDHCLHSFDGMIVLHASDSGDEDSSEEEEDDTGQELTDADGPPCAKD